MNNGTNAEEKKCPFCGRKGSVDHRGLCVQHYNENYGGAIEASSPPDDMPIARMQRQPAVQVEDPVSVGRRSDGCIVFDLGNGPFAISASNALWLHKELGRIVGAG